MVIRSKPPSGKESMTLIDLQTTSATTEEDTDQGCEEGTNTAGHEAITEPDYDYQISPSPEPNSYF
jgi:hypothetical protein